MYVLQTALCFYISAQKIYVSKLRLNKIGKKRPYNIADMRILKQDNVVQQAKEGLTGNSKSCGIK